MASSSSKKAKLPVCINVFPTLDYVELVQLDDETRDILVTASAPCAFEGPTRQVDAEIFSQVIRELYSVNRIPFNTPAVLVLPSFFTRSIELPQEFGKEELKFALISEAERFHVFKNVEALVDWVKIREGEYIYSAFPKAEIEKYHEVFQELRVPIRQIELNYFSIIRGLLATGTITQAVEQQEAWGLMVLSDSNFFLAQMEGIRVISMYDTPISQNITPQELLEEIREDYSLALEADHYELSQLVIVNNIPLLASDTLIEKLGLKIPVANIDQNGNTLASRGSTTALYPCTLEALGGVLISQIQDLPSLTFRHEGAASANEIAEFKAKATKISFLCAAGLFVLSMLIWGVLSLVVFLKTEELNSLQKEQASFTYPKSLGSYDDIQRKLFVKHALDQNIVINNMMIRLGTVISDDMWLDTLSIQNNLSEDAGQAAPPANVNIDGYAITTERINQLTSDLQRVFQRNDLIVPITEPKTEGDTTYWHWQIQTQNTDPAASGNPTGGP